jgi:hypothetical protein
MPLSQQNRFELHQGINLHQNISRFNRFANSSVPKLICIFCSNRLLTISILVGYCTGRRSCAGILQMFV